MNPAFRIWGIAIAQCTLLCLALSLAAHESGIIMLILLIVAFASLVSLLGFYLMYELLHLLRPARPVLRLATIFGTSAIVVFNAACLLLFLLDSGAGWSRVWRDLGEVFLLAAIPLLAALIGTAACYKRIEEYCGGIRQFHNSPIQLAN